MSRTEKLNLDAMKEIAFYARKIVAVPSGTENNTALAATAVKNLTDYGFVIDESGMKKLSTASKEDITNWYYKTAQTLNELAGGNHKYRPFYPDFPRDVMTKSDYELFVDQMIHYWTGYIPEGKDPKEGVKSLEEHDLKVLETIDGNNQKEVVDTAKAIFKNTLASKSNPSQGDVANIINAYINANPNWTNDARTCENRKTLSYIYAVALLRGKNTSNMPSLVTNDYMRIARLASLLKANNGMFVITPDSGETSPIGTLPRSMRRFIANGIDSQKNFEEDVARAKQDWKILLQKIHIGEFKNCQHANEVAVKLRNNQPLNTFYSRIENAFEQKRYSDVVKMYQSRPGEFIKNFNRMLTVNIDDPVQKIAYATQLINASKDVFSRTRPEDLVRFIAYMRARTREDMIPVHNVKGKLVVTDQKYAPIPKSTAQTFINIAKEGIAQQIRTGQSYGRVYLDPNMSKMPLPSDVKDTASAMNKYPKGARFSPEKDEHGQPKNIRAFVWWTNMDKDSRHSDDIYSYGGERGRVDLDLSCNFFKKSEDGTIYPAGATAYHSGYKHNGCTHSGDITNGGPAGGNGVTECIDMDIQELKKSGVDYVQLYVNSFTGQPLSEVPCLGGWQEREELDKSQTFDIKAVKQTSSLGEGDIRGVTQFLYDVKNDEIIWVDSPDLKAKTASNSLGAMSSMRLLLERYAKGDQMTMAEMVEVAVKANGGVFVDSPEKADTIFSVDAYQGRTEEQRVITAKDQDIWLGEFMSPQTPDEPLEKDRELADDLVVEQDREENQEEDREEEPKDESYDEYPYHSYDDIDIDER